jgi:hypothetical protein
MNPTAHVESSVAMSSPEPGTVEFVKLAVQHRSLSPKADPGHGTSLGSHRATNLIVG